MKQNLVKRSILYIVGLLFIAFGVSLSVNAKLGVSPVNSLPYVLSQITGRAMSSCVIGVFCTYILLQILILRKAFKWINLTQIIFSTIFGYFVDFTTWLIGDFCTPTYIGTLLMLIMSMLLIAFGIMLYVQTELVPMPMEGLAIAIAQKTGKSFAAMKTVLDCSIVALGAALSLLCMGTLIGIREGTIVSAIAIGQMISFLKKYCSLLLKTMSKAMEKNTNKSVEN